MQYVTPAIDFSPHLTSPVGEGQLLLAVRYSMDYPQTRVTCISPTGENERGLTFRTRVTSPFPWGRLGWVVPLGWLG